jgi:hypothetical protein
MLDVGIDSGFDSGFDSGIKLVRVIWLSLFISGGMFAHLEAKINPDS